MAMTDDFVADARRFGAKRPIGVNERGLAGIFHRKTKKIYGQSVVLCRPERFYP